MSTDVIIIGAGPAGSIAASTLLSQGFSVQIIEKERFPRFVIGESLLPRCMDILDKTGFLPVLEKQNYQKKYGAVFIRGDEHCEFQFSDQFTDGWSWTWQVPRDDFDKVLADEVAKMGAQIAYETQVMDISFSDTTQKVIAEDIAGNRKIYEARFIIDASGYGRVIPKLQKLDKPSTLDNRNSLFSHIIDDKRPNSADAERITIIDKQKGVWIWIIPFSNGKTSIGVVADPQFLNQYKGSNSEKLISILSEEKLIKQQFPNIKFAFDPICVKAYSIGIKQLFGQGYILTGNATEFLDPVFSSGVTFAVESGYQSAKLVAKHLKGEEVNWEQDYTKYISQGVETFRTFVNSWYDDTLQSIFFAQDVNSRIKAQLCSVLAGYVWDKKNPYVRNHRNAIPTLANLIKHSSPSIT